MSDFFGLGMIGSYKSRKVDRFEADWGFISTARVTDGSKPYETAVQHKDYGDGNMVIVECYDTKEQAQAGHVKWVGIMTSNPPDELVDCNNAGLAQFGSALGANFNKKRNS